MDKNDRLGWPYGAVFTIGAKSVGFRCNDSEVLQQICRGIEKPVSPSPPKTVDRVVSLRVGQPSKRKGVKNYHIAYLGYRPVKRSLQLDEVLGEAKKLIELEALLLDDQFAHVASHLFAAREGARLICLTGPPSDCSELVSELMETEAEPDASSFSSFTAGGRVLFRPVHKEGPHMARHGLTLITDFIHLETEPKIKTLGEFVIHLFSRTNGGVRGHDCIEMIREAVAQAPCHILRNRGIRERLATIQNILEQPPASPRHLTFHD